MIDSPGESSGAAKRFNDYCHSKKIEPDLSRPRYLQTVTGGYLFLP